MTPTRADMRIELEAIVADVQDGHLPVETVVDELRDELAGDDERRVEVLHRALARVGAS